ncbi:MAG: Urease accessory protein UreD [Labilithrix sp.]|nr:Urease accessory protein UreD [Labilithrix sp.]
MAVAEAPAARPSGHGRGTIVASAAHGATTLERLTAASPLRFLRPTLPGSRAADVCLVTLGGGLMDGDVLDLDLTVGPGATLLVFTQSSTKVFRGRSRQTIRADVHGTLVLLPDPVACFADADFTQRVDVALHGEGSAVLLDGFTSGRPAYGERWSAARIALTTTVTRNGVLAVRDALVLDRADGPLAPRLDAFEAFATLIAIGPRVAPVRAGVLAASPLTAALVAAPSAIAGQADAAIVRIAATRPMNALAEARGRLRDLLAIGVVDPFLSRH